MEEKEVLNTAGEEVQDYQPGRKEGKKERERKCLSCLWRRRSKGGGGGRLVVVVVVVVDIGIRALEVVNSVVNGNIGDGGDYGDCNSGRHCYGVNRSS